ncbi:MAG TPA: hypothetical protein VL025_06015 [Thermoanaerobaculia bacterium]|nr:hypothetical protein [Thermoanaerobaculia bacterium]
MHSSSCPSCGNEVPLSRELCPHCGHQGPPPNVKAASTIEERQALDRRYQAAVQEAEARGAGKAVEALEVALRESKAVTARSFRELDRLASSDKEIFSTYYNLVRADVRLPHGNDWDELRSVADEKLFPFYKDQIRFAALSLDGAGLPHYGEASFVFRESMIAHRASVYEENSALFLKRHAYQPPPGHRATWAERAKLAVAKLAGEVDAVATAERFADLLLGAGAASAEDDRFVEVHIWGPLSIRTVERALLTGSRKGQRSARKAVRDCLKYVGLTLEEIS